MSFSHVNIYKNYVEQNNMFDLNGESMCISFNVKFGFWSPSFPPFLTIYSSASTRKKEVHKQQKVHYKYAKQLLVNHVIIVYYFMAINRNVISFLSKRKFGD